MMEGAPARRCGACDRSFTGKAGRVVAGKALCPTCSNRLRPPVSCSSCGRKTARPRREPKNGQLVCEGCLDRGKRATCCRCRRHRIVASRNDKGRATCVSCASAEPPSHACPDCRAIVAGTGCAPCHACSLRRLTAKFAAESASTIGVTWARALFEEFADWEGLPSDRHAIGRRMPAYAGFFAAIGKGCTEPGEITQARLLKLVGVEGLRLQQLPVRFLAERLRLEWAQSDSEAFNETRRIETLLLEQATQTWTADLGTYQAHLADSGAQQKSVRVYLTAAISFMSSARIERASELTQVHVDRFLRRRPGHRASLGPFTTWLREVASVRIAIAPKKNGNPRTRERTVLAKSRVLLDRLKTASDPREGRAVLAAAIAQVFQLPLSMVLALTLDEAATGRAAIELWPISHRLTLPPVLEVGFRRFAAQDGRLVFPGRNGVQPLSLGAISHQLSRQPHGISGRQARRQRHEAPGPKA